MSDALPDVIVDVYRIDPDTEEETQIGQAEYHADGRLELLGADPDIEAQLVAAIDAVNRKPRIVELAPPPDGSDLPRSTGSRVTERDALDFMQALNRYLRQYYGFSIG